jgi:hypothetical protein
MLLIAEVKEIAPARYGYKAVIKHVPDQAFAMDEQLFRRLGRRFETELALWGANEVLHMVMIATFALTAAGLPTIVELSLMSVTGQWLPIGDSFELQLVEKLLREERAFAKALRYNLPSGHLPACAILTDAADSPIPLCLDSPGRGNEGYTTTESQRPVEPSLWTWRAGKEAVPPFPPIAQPRAAIDERAC